MLGVGIRLLLRVSSTAPVLVKERANQYLDVDMLMTDCAFPTTSYGPSATSVLAGINVQATAPGASASSTGMKMGSAGRMEVAAGMVMGGLGLGAGLVVAIL